MNRPIDPKKLLLENYLNAINQVMREMEIQVNKVGRYLKSDNHQVQPKLAKKPAELTEK